MRWDGVRWVEMGWNGLGWIGMGWDGSGWVRQLGWVGWGEVGIGSDGMGSMGHLKPAERDQLMIFGRIGSQNWYLNVVVS